MPQTRMFRDRVVSMEQTLEGGEKNLELLKILCREALPEFTYREHTLDHERDLFVMVLDAPDGRTKRVCWTRMMLFDAERIPALTGDSLATLRARIVDFLRSRAGRPEDRGDVPASRGGVGGHSRAAPREETPQRPRRPGKARGRARDPSVPRQARATAAAAGRTASARTPSGAAGRAGGSVRPPTRPRDPREDAGDGASAAGAGAAVRACPLLRVRPVRRGLHELRADRGTGADPGRRPRLCSERDRSGSRRAGARGAFSPGSPGRSGGDGNPRHDGARGVRGIRRRHPLLHPRARGARPRLRLDGGHRLRQQLGLLLSRLEVRIAGAEGDHPDRGRLRTGAGGLRLDRAPVGLRRGQSEDARGPRRR